MANSREKKFTDEQIIAAKKTLQSLKQKETKKTRDEVFIALEKDINDALKKGYSLKEISEKLRENGILLSVTFLKSFHHKDENNEKILAENLAKNVQKSEKRLSNNVTKNAKNEEAKVDGFVVPDTPDDEL